MSLSLNRLEAISQYENKSFTGRADLWTDRKAVEQIVQSAPLLPREVELQVSAIINAVSLIIDGTLEENYSLILGIGDTLLMEPYITSQDKDLLEKKLRTLESWGTQKLGYTSNNTLH